MRRFSVLLGAGVALLLGSTSPEASAQALGRFSKAEIFFEENATAGDLGVHFLVDGDPWHRIMIFRPDGESFVEVEVRGSSRVTGLTEIFSESAEPSFQNLSRAQFLARFPAGPYNLLGLTVDGRWLVGVATLTHSIPAAPKVVAPKEGAEVDHRQPLVIQWDPVANPPGSTIDAYQVIVEKDEEEERLRVLTIDMMKTDTSVTIPVGFLEPGREYKIEVLAIEKGGNKTITEVAFETKDE